MSSSVCAWVIVSFHNCHINAARLKSLRLCQTGNSRRILHSYFKMTASPPVTARLEMPQRETDRRKTLSPRLNLCKTTAVCTARSYRNTIKMIFLPSHISCCAGFCINVLRIKNNMLRMPSSNLL